MLKLTIPERDNFYADLIRHPRVVRVVALSGGFSRVEANARLRKNPGLIASFSRACWRGSPPSNPTPSSTQRSMNQFRASSRLLLLESLIGY